MQRRNHFWFSAIIVLICVVTYGSSLSGELLWDDEFQIAKNPIIRQLSNIPTEFTQPVWAFAQDGQSNISNFYRPIQIVLYTLGYAMGGLSPTPYHAINLLFHTLASLMVYAVCLELGFAAPLALLGGALFAAHPIHTEAVAWIAATPELTCGFL